MTARAAIVRSLDATLVAGVFAALVDMVPEVIGGRLGGPGFLLALAMVTAAALLAGGVVFVVAQAAPRADASRARRFLPVVAALVLSIPLLDGVVRLAGDPGLPLVLAILALAAVGWGAWKLAGRASSPTAWLAAAVVAEQLVFRGGRSVELVARLDPGRPGAPFLILFAAVVASVGFSELARDLVPGDGPPPARWRAAIAAALGLGLLAGAINLAPDLYRGPHRMAYLAAFLLLGASLARARLPGGLAPRAGAAALALAGAVYVALLLRLPSPVPWQLATGTRLARDLVGESGLFDRPFRRFLGDVRRRPLSVEPAAPATVRPAVARSVLLITVDTLRFDHVGYSGVAPAGLTPALDALAAGSLRFRRAYSQGASTSLSMPALHWSRYPKDIRFVPLYRDDQLRLYFADQISPGVAVARWFESPRDEPNRSLAETLASVGFVTVAVPNDGPTRFLEPRIGLSRGFQTTIYPAALLGDRHAEAGAGDGLVAEAGIAALREFAGRPFFLWLHFYDPHAPHRAPPGVSRPGYAGEIEHVDALVGRVLLALREAGLEDQTMVVFTSDHGELFKKGDTVQGFHGIDLREALVHVPLLVRVPGAAPRDVDEVVAHVDLAPTILAGLGMAAPKSMTGRDLSPIWNGAALPPRPAYLETWILEPGTGEPMLHQIGAVSGPVKVILDLGSSGAAFFDLERDPGEEDNRFVSSPEPRFLDVAAQLVRWYGL